MATPTAVVTKSSTKLHKLMTNPRFLNKTLTGLRTRPTSDYLHHWIPVPGVATPKKISPTATASAYSEDAAPSILTATGERTRMRWQQSKVSARTLANMRKKIALLERAGLAGGPVPGAELLNLPPPKPLSTKTVRMGKPDKGRKHDRTAPLRKAKIAKAIAEMPKTIETWKKAKIAEQTKVKSTLPF